MVQVRRTGVQKRPSSVELPSWVHPDVRDRYADWKRIRHCVEGEKAIKAQGEEYLPRFERMDNAEYAAYRDRACFYNFTGRTVNALVGTVFRREYGVEGVPDRFSDLLLKSATKKNETFDEFVRTVASEVLAMGRYGVLVDLPAKPTSTPKPYFAGYRAEDILDWELVEDPDTGRDVLVKVVLREFVLVRDSYQQQQTKTQFRVLLLEDGVYKQRVYSTIVNNDMWPSLTQKPDSEVIPRVRGTTLDYLPFYFFGVISNTPDVEKPPMLDIADLNISHFRSYAHLEHGRFYTGMPVYHVEVGNGDTGEYVIGPSQVWETPMGTKPGLLEFNGNGLKFLENALDQKAEHAASLGGRIMGVRTQATAESDNALQLKERNEQVHLLNVTKSLDLGITKLVSWFLVFAGARDNEIKDVDVIFNKDFLFDGIGSREFRAVLAMYKDGILPISIIYTYLRKAEVIPDWMKRDEFKKLLDDTKEFPNNPDIAAKKQGFADARAMQSADEHTDVIDIEQQLADIEEMKIKLEEKKAAAQERQAKLLAKRPAPTGQPPRPTTPV